MWCEFVIDIHVIVCWVTITSTQYIHTQSSSFHLVHQLFLFRNRREHHYYLRLTFSAVRAVNVYITYLNACRYSYWFYNRSCVGFYFGYIIYFDIFPYCLLFQFIYSFVHICDLLFFLLVPFLQVINLYRHI